MADAPQVVLWNTGKISLVSELVNEGNLLSNSPIPVGTKVSKDELNGVVLAGREFGGLPLHRHSILVQCSEGVQVWFVPPVKPKMAIKRPVPKKELIPNTTVKKFPCPKKVGLR